MSEKRGQIQARFILTTFVCCVVTQAHAGRPLSTEDASTLEDGRCQVEAWVDRSSVSTSPWFVPACNVGAGIEWQVGFARTHEDGRPSFMEGYAQAKRVFKPIAEGSPWGMGLVVGFNRHVFHRQLHGWDQPYALIPVSIAMGDALLHLNAGWARDREFRRDATLWGIAYEKPATERLTLVAEAYGENAAKPFLRAGGRMSVIKDVLDIDLTGVARPGGNRSERFVSLGLYWQSARFIK